MDKPNREWKSFGARWSASSRFEKFIFWSVIVHLALFAAAGLPSYRLYQERVELKRAEERLQELKKQEAEKAAKQAEEEIKKALKEELAAEQLKELYNELTADFLTPQQAELYWDELLAELDPDLEAFADIFGTELFDQLRARELIQEIRERMIAKLRDLVLRDIQKSLELELLARAGELAKQLAEMYKTELAKQIGDPIGDSFKKLVQDEEAANRAKLEAADRELTAALQSARLAADALRKGKTKFEEQAKALAAADQSRLEGPKSASQDTKTAAADAAKLAAAQKAAEKAVAQLQQQVKSGQPGMDAAAALIDNARGRLKNATDQLAGPMPGLATRLGEANAGSAVSARDEARAAARSAGEGKPASAAAQADTSLGHLRDTIGAAERAQAAVQLQIAADTAARLARESLAHATAAKDLAKQQADANQAGDLKQAAQVASKMTASAKGVDRTEQGVDQLGQQLARVAQTLEGMEAESRAEGQKSPAGDAKTETGHSQPATRSSRPDQPQAASQEQQGEAGAPKTPGSRPAARDSETSAADEIGTAASRTGLVKTDLARGKDALTIYAPTKAADNFQNAAEKLGQVGADIRAAGRRIGLGDASLGDELSSELQKLASEKLAGQVRTEFDKLYNEKALPAIMSAVGQAVEQRLKTEQAFTEAFSKKLMDEVGKELGSALTEKVSAGDQVAEAVEKKVPARHRTARPHGPHAEHGPDSGEEGEGAVAARVGELKGAGERTANQIVASNLAAVVQAGVRHPALAAFGQRKRGQTTEDTSRAALAERLSNLTSQLATGRHGFLGQASDTAIAALHSRHRGRAGGLSRLRGYGDMDAAAYRKIVETIKDRGQIVGEDLRLQGAAGPTSVADDANILRPALVSLPNEPEEKKTEKAEEKRSLPTPTFKTNRFTGVPFLAENRIKIDGDLSDWKDLPSIELDPILKGPRKGLVQPDHQKAWIAYTSRGILAALDVVDTTKELDNQRPTQVFWLDDCVEIYFDTLNTKDPRRGEQNTHQFFTFPFDHKNVEADVGGFEVYIPRDTSEEGWKHIPFTQDQFPKAAKKTDKGWAIEFMVPKKLLRQGEIRPGRIIGFNLQLDTGSDLYYYWTCASVIISSQHPNTWGDIQFLGSDATIEIVDKDGREIARSILPGQPVRVRVTDPDMNLDDLKKDKVSVVLRTDAGDTETLILEETERKSGVFVGAVPTCLNVGVPQTGSLEVFEGEYVTAEYIDQARAYGESNVPIKTSFFVSSMGMKLANQ